MLFDKKNYIVTDIIKLNVGIPPVDQSLFTV